MASMDINLTAIPGEALLTAALNFASRLLDLAIANREGMDPALRKREDEVRVRGLERVERLWDRIDKVLNPAEPK